MKSKRENQLKIKKSIQRKEKMKKITIFNPFSTLCPFYSFQTKLNFHTLKKQLKKNKDLQSGRHPQRDGSNCLAGKKIQNTPGMHRSYNY